MVYEFWVLQSLGVCTLYIAIQVSVTWGCYLLPRLIIRKKSYLTYLTYSSLTAIVNILSYLKINNTLGEEQFW